MVQAVVMLMYTVVNLFISFVLWSSSFSLSSPLRPNSLMLYSCCSSVSVSQWFNPQRSLQNKRMLFFKRSSASDCHYRKHSDSSIGLIPERETYDCSEQTSFGTEAKKNLHTYTQHTDMQAIISVSNWTRLFMHFCCFGCVFFSFIQVTNKIIRAELTIGFNMAVFGSIRSTWNSEHDVFVCVHACLWEARCEHVKWLVFVSLEQSFFFYPVCSPTVSNQCEGYSTFCVSLC